MGPKKTKRTRGAFLIFKTRGLAEKVAKIEKISAQAVQGWKNTGVPLTRIDRVSKTTGIPKEQLREDIYG